MASYKPDEGSADIDVAVKLVRVNADASEKEDFLGEAELMLSLDFPTRLKVRNCDFQNICQCIELSHSAGIWRVCIAEAVAADH